MDVSCKFHESHTSLAQQCLIHGWISYRYPPSCDPIYPNKLDFIYPKRCGSGKNSFFVCLTLSTDTNRPNYRYVQSALIAATDAQLLTFMKGLNLTDPTENFSMNLSAYNIMLGFNYAGLFLTISAIMSQLIMTEIFNELPLNAARRETTTEGSRIMPKQGNISGSLPQVLARYGAGSGLRWISWHCKYGLHRWLHCIANAILISRILSGFISFYFGIIFSVLGVLTYVLIEEPMATKILMSLLMLNSLLPLLHYLPSCCSPRKGT